MMHAKQFGDNSKLPFATMAIGDGMWSTPEMKKHSVRAFMYAFNRENGQGKTLRMLSDRQGFIVIRIA